MGYRNVQQGQRVALFLLLLWTHSLHLNTIQYLLVRAANKSNEQQQQQQSKVEERIFAKFQTTLSVLCRAFECSTGKSCFLSIAACRPVHAVQPIQSVQILGRQPFIPRRSPSPLSLFFCISLPIHQETGGQTSYLMAELHNSPASFHSIFTIRHPASSPKKPSSISPTSISSSSWPTNTQSGHVIILLLGAAAWPLLFSMCAPLLAGQPPHPPPHPLH